MKSDLIDEVGGSTLVEVQSVNMRFPYAFRRKMGFWLPYQKLDTTLSRKFFELMTLACRRRGIDALSLAFERA